MVLMSLIAIDSRKLFPSCHGISFRNPKTPSSNPPPPDPQLLALLPPSSSHPRFPPPIVKGRALFSYKHFLVIDITVLTS